MSRTLLNWDGGASRGVDVRIDKIIIKIVSKITSIGVGSSIY